MATGWAWRRNVLRGAWPLLSLTIALNITGCHQRQTVAPGYHEYAYVTNGKSNSVSVLDLLQLRNIKTIAVGSVPSVSPLALRVMKSTSPTPIPTTSALSMPSGTGSAAVIGVHRAPYYVSVSSDGKRAYAANSGSANVSVIDLTKRAAIATIPVGGAPGLARVSPDGKVAVASNRADNTVSIIDTEKLAVRRTVSVCQQPQDMVIVPDNSKVFVACPGSNQVAVVDLKVGPAAGVSRRGTIPVQLTLKPDGGELFASNFNGNTSRSSKPGTTRLVAAI